MELRKDTDNFTQVNVIGGYVNFSCTARVWMKILNTVSNPEMIKPWKWKTIVVDYIGANAGKPLHIGHLCTPSVGQTICNIYNHLGYRVIGDSHFGDWGGIFGKLIWSFKNDGIAAFSTESDKVYYREEFLRNLSISNILELYQSFHLPILWTEDEVVKKQEERESWAREEFKKLSEWDPENVELWKKFTAISIAGIEWKLDLLNVHATYNIGESFYEGLDLPRPNNEDYPDLEWNMKDIVKELIEKWVATQNEDGSVGVIFPEESKLPSCILQKKDGTGLYLTSDLAAIKYRLNNSWSPSKIIYSVYVCQQLPLRQAFAIA